MHRWSSTLTWADERARYPVLERHAYLNAGTFGPLSRGTLDAMAAVRAREAERGRAGKEYYDGMWAQRDSIRALLAAQLSVEPAQVVLTESTTQAVHVVVVGLRLGPDDEIVTTDAEHFGLAGPLAASGARLRIARVRDLPAADVFDAVRALVTPRTRLLALSAVSWLDGKLIPWRELAEQTGLPVLVDGAQSVGALEVDASAADFYTVSGQKWLCGPDATGALYVREAEALEPRLVAYPGAESYDIAAGTWEPKPGAARFDPIFTPVSSLAGLATALRELPDGRFERARALTERCRELLLEAGEDVVSEANQATLVAFRARGDAAEISADLYARGVVVRDLPGSDLLRASVGWWNDESDLVRLVDALQART
jgi:L-cysteine/cystine lyase